MEQIAVSTARKPTRTRELRPDSNGTYRPYIGWTVRNYKPIQPRFNLGYDLVEAKKRYTRIQELYADDCQARGERYWSSFGLYAAKLIARGIYRIPYSPPIEILEVGVDPIAEYAQLLEIQRRAYPSLEIVPADEEWYSLSVKSNQQIERDVMRDLETDLRQLGIISTQKKLPSRLVPGTLHEAFDAYVKSDIDGVNVIPGTNILRQFGRKRTERVARLKDHSLDIPLYTLGLDEVKDLVNH